jgi:hypothetical protein
MKETNLKPEQQLTPSEQQLKTETENAFKDIEAAAKTNELLAFEMGAFTVFSLYPENSEKTRQVTICNLPNGPLEHWILKEEA